MKLLELVKEYFLHQGGSQEYLNEIEVHDGIFTFSIEDETLCTITEKRVGESDKYKISILASLNEYSNEEELLKGYEKYAYKLRCTPLYQKGYFVVTEKTSIGFAYDAETSNIDGKSFSHLMDIFVATVQFILDKTADDEDFDEQKEYIFNRLFVPMDNRDYLRLLKECDIDENTLDNDFGSYSVDENFVTNISFHELSGMMLLDNAFQCDDTNLILILLYLNGMGIDGSYFDYNGGYLHLITTLDPKNAKKDDFIDKLLVQKFLFDKVQNYVKNEYKHVEEFNIKDIMTAIFA